MQKVLEQVDFRVSENGSELRACQRHAKLQTPVQLLLFRDMLELAIKVCRPLKVNNQLPRKDDLLASTALCDRKRQRLAVVISENQSSNVIRHRREQLIPLFLFQMTADDRRGERYLDIDFVVRCIDAGRIVYGIGVKSCPLKSRFNASSLCHPQIGALTNDLNAKLIRADPNGIVRTVANLDIGFGRCPHVSADTSKIQ